MNIKKVISVALMGTVMASALTTGVLYVSAVEKNLFSYQYKASDKTYAYYYCYPGYTAVASKKSGYEGSYKYALYIQYGESNGSYYEINSASNGGTSQPVYSGSQAVTAEVALRSHSGRIHLTSVSSSEIKETFGLNVYKE